MRERSRPYVWLALPQILFVVVSAMPLRAETPGLSADEIQRLRDEAVGLINADRTAAGVPPVELDRNLSAMGDLFCDQALKHGLRGHYLTDGFSPFHRCAFWINGTDYTGQNVCSTFGVNGAVWTYDQLAPKLREYEQMMMAETPPNDRHRRNIINPWHTHVGIGLGWGPTGIRMTHEFANRLVAVNEIAREHAIGSAPVFGGRILDTKRFDLAGITVFYDPTPTELTPEEADRHDSYGLPEEYRFLRLLLPEGRFYTDTRSRGDIAMSEDGVFACRLFFWNDAPGIYSVMVRLKERAGDSDTQIPATYVCLRVFAPPAEGETATGLK
jgi:hypothetical protein